MACRLRSLCRFLLGLALVFGLGGPALRAQLDPKLQPPNSTDFLDLFQESTSLKVKPEIAAVFDFSGSMKSLMNHPLYINNDVGDTDDYREMSFSLTPAVASYTIKAAAAGSTGVYALLTINIAGNTSGASNTDAGGSYQIVTSSSGTSNVITVSPSSGPYTAGQTLTFTTYLKTTKSNKGVNWSWNGTSGGALTTTGPGSSNPYQATATWTIPNLPTVNASLDPTAGNSPVSGITYLTSALGGGQLVHPDGSLVTASNFYTPDTNSGLYGASAGMNDVRNWVRQASHVRFTAAVGSDTRTIDIPIPWKITNGSSTGNPLSSVTYFDREVKTNPDNSTTTYGSGTYIEADTIYRLSSGSVVLSGNSGTQASTTLDIAVEYRPAYISWLFNGKYANGSYAGKYIIFDAGNTLAGGQLNASWGQGYGNAAAGQTIMVPQYTIAGTYTGEVSQPASVNVTPALSRCQAVKSAAIQTWIGFQGDVFWAFRFLDTSNESGNSTIDYKSTTTFYNNGYGGDSGWTLLNNTPAQGITSTSGNSVTGMNRIAGLMPNNGTPLTYAISRALAQFSDPNSVFNAVETGADAPSQCMNHYLILFTDGIDNNNTTNNNTNANSPYLTTTGTGTASVSSGNAQAGNRALLLNKTYINNTSTWWNMFTYAGIAAHLADPSLGTAGTDYMVAPTYPTSGTHDKYLPYAITGRNGTSFARNHRISTMTVGVSLGGVYNDPASPKNHLFLTAAVGDMTLGSWNTSQLQPFALANPSDPSQGRKAGTINFFDASNPTLVSQALYNAFTVATLPSNVNATSNPNIPFVGAALANQIYLGKFQPPANGGPIWTGDLLMFDTKVVNSQTVILDTSANPVGTNTDAAHAQWSAASALFNNRSWTARNLYTRLPGPDPANPPGALQAFSDVDTLPSPNASAYTNLKPYVALKQTTDATKRSVIQFAMGGDTGGTFTTGTPPRPTTNRGTIMGDIVDSTPTSVEYNINDWAAQIAANPVLSTLGNPSHFRLILVGTNQGWLHAFGEVTTVVQTTDSSGAVQQQVLGKVDELWSFMPTDLLANLDYITVTNNPHRFMVDGPPTIYFLDLPPATGGQGNGVVDQLSTYGTPERALVIFGLGKGGRSYYALNIQNPFLPKLQWSLVPDEMAEAATAKGVTPVQYPFPHTITGGPSAKTVTDIMMNWGYSTCTPSIGRVMFNGVLHDAVFFGGGFSTSAVEANYNNVPLGRSVLAVDAWTGQALAAVDLTAASISGNPATIGPIASSLVPFEFFLGSGLAQRAYFQDFFGGLWAWGSKKTDTSTSTSGYRIDSSDITLWTSDGSISGKPGIRKVYQDSNGRNVYSSTPAPFRVGSFPGKGKSTSLAVPSAVGIAMESGNRNNPLDYYYTTSTKPANYRVTVAFDRQDSQNWGLDTPGGPDTGITDLSLLNVTGYTRSDSTSAPDAVTPGKSSYYLAPASGTPYFGYFLNFPGLTNNFFPKGINAPSVVSGSLFYSYFTPTTADPCTGGSGNTYSNFICDVYNPVQVDSRSNLACASGQDTIWSGVASNYVASGTTGTIQGGMLAPSAADAAKGVLPSLALVTVLGKSEQRHPKPRVWRTVQ